MDMPTPLDVVATARALLAGDTTIPISAPDDLERYVVGGLGTITIPARMRNHPAALGIVLALLDECPDDAETVGSWTDRETVYVDFGSTHADRLDAERIADARGELAYWDSETSTALRTFTSLVADR